MLTYLQCWIATLDKIFGIISVPKGLKIDVSWSNIVWTNHSPHIKLYWRPSFRQDFYNMLSFHANIYCHVSNFFQYYYIIPSVNSLQYFIHSQVMHTSLTINPQKSGNPLSIGHHSSLKSMHRDKLFRYWCLLFDSTDLSESLISSSCGRFSLNNPKSYTVLHNDYYILLGTKQ